jgi:hypothetical protein
MLKMLPEGAVKQKMIQDGVTDKDIDSFFTSAALLAGPQPTQAPQSASVEDKPRTVSTSTRKAALNDPTNEADAASVARDKLKPKKKWRESKAPLRALFWKKIAPAQLLDTVWTNVTDDTVELDVNDIETLFAKVGGEETGASGGGVDKKKVISPKEAKKKETEKDVAILLLDADRQRNSMLRLKHFKMSSEEIKTAILEMDETKLNLESVESLKMLAPTQEEAAVILAYSGDVERLGPVEKFLLTLMSIPSLPTRLKAFEIKLAFKDQVAPVFDRLAAVHVSCFLLK